MHTTYFELGSLCSQRSHAGSGFGTGAGDNLVPRVLEVERGPWERGSAGGWFVFVRGLAAEREITSQKTGMVVCGLFLRPFV